MIRVLLESVRVRQWTKNLICFAGVIFGERMDQAWAWGRAGATFAVFCALSSAVYILNDLGDRARDQTHPKKSLRPIASGRLPPRVAAFAAAILGVTGLAAMFLLDSLAGACAAGYLVLNAAYTAGLKHGALIDVLCIAIGFILRLLSGVYVLGDIPTTWIVLCTLFLALFLGFCKRHGEMSATPAEVSLQRPALERYRALGIGGLIDSSATMTILCYALFTGLSGKNPNLVVTVPIIFYAVMRYREVVLTRHVGEEPENVLLREHSIQIAITLWLAIYLLIVHGNRAWFRTH